MAEIRVCTNCDSASTLQTHYWLIRIRAVWSEFAPRVKNLGYLAIIRVSSEDSDYGHAHSARSRLIRLITKTCLYNVDPLKPHFYIVKLGFTGVYMIFFFLLKNIDYGYSLEPPRRGGSNEYPQSMFWAEIWKISEFLSEKKIHFLVVKFSVYLNRRVFVMWRYMY